METQAQALILKIPQPPFQQRGIIYTPLFIKEGLGEIGNKWVNSKKSGHPAASFSSQIILPSLEGRGPRGG
jgi:hypothetical protein